MIVPVLAAVSLLAPAPDPGPNGGHVRMVRYAYDVPAVVVEGRFKGQLIPGQWFRCVVPVHGPRWCVPHGKMVVEDAGPLR